MYVFACCVQYVFTRWNSKQTYYKLPWRYRKWHREQPEVHQLQVCIKATGTNIKISCRKPSSSVDGDLSMQQNGFVHRWWPSKQWFKETPTYKQCFDPLWNKRSKRNIIFRFNHILKRTCYMFHIKGLFHHSILITSILITCSWHPNSMGWPVGEAHLRSGFA